MARLFLHPYLAPAHPMNFFRRCWSSRSVRAWCLVSGLVALSVLGLGVRFGLPAWRDWRARSLDVQCRKLRDSRDWQQLGKVAAAWARSDPRRTKALFFQAEAEVGQERYAEAAELLFRVPKSDPKSIPAYLQGANLLLGQANRPLEGIAALERLLTIEPRVTAAHQSIIQFYALSLQRQKLLKSIRLAIESDREPPEAYVYLLLVDTLRLSNGVEMNNLWLQAYPDHELFLVGRALQMDEVKVNANDLDAGSPNAGAVPGVAKQTSVRSRLLADLLQRFPHNVELLSYHIEQALLAGESDRVVQLMNQAPGEIDTDNRFWRYKGQIHENQGETAAAESAYRRALEINRLDWATMNRLATIERLRGRFPEVERLQRLGRQADTLREQVRKYPTAEQVGVEWLRSLKSFAQAAGDDFISESIARRVEDK